MRKSRSLCSLFFAPILLLLAACDEAADSSAIDAGMIDGAIEVDAGCEPTSVLPYDWRPIDEVSEGEIVAETDTMAIATIDATAGGMSAYGDAPYIYLDLATGNKVELTDVESYGGGEWDLALKRMVIRINGGDSGLGGVEAATVPGTSLDDVVSTPDDDDFATDDFATDDCELNAGALDEPLTAMGTWYEYDVNTHLVTPTDNVYVIRARDGQLFKFRVVTYYGDDDDDTRGAVYDVEWAPM